MSAGREGMRLSWRHTKLGVRLSYSLTLCEDLDTERAEIGSYLIKKGSTSHLGDQDSSAVRDDRSVRSAHRVPYHCCLEMGFTGSL